MTCPANRRAAALMQPFKGATATHRTVELNCSPRIQLFIILCVRRPAHHGSPGAPVYYFEIETSFERTLRCATCQQSPKISASDKLLLLKHVTGRTHGCTMRTLCVKARSGRVGCRSYLDNGQLAAGTKSIGRSVVHVSRGALCKFIHHAQCRAALALSHLKETTSRYLPCY